MDRSDDRPCARIDNPYGRHSVWNQLDRWFSKKVAHAEGAGPFVDLRERLTSGHRPDSVAADRDQAVNGLDPAARLLFDLRPARPRSEAVRWRYHFSARERGYYVVASAVGMCC
jgi:hypothetical protein